MDEHSEAIERLADAVAKLQADYQYLRFQAGILCRRLQRDYSDVLFPNEMDQVEHVLALSA